MAGHAIKVDRKCRTKIERRHMAEGTWDRELGKVDVEQSREAAAEEIA